MLWEVGFPLLLEMMVQQLLSQGQDPTSHPDNLASAS